MKLDNVQLAKGKISEKTTVLINLSGGGTGKDRISVSDAITLGDLGINPDEDVQIREIEFPIGAVGAISGNQSLSAEEKFQKIQDIQRKYETALNAFKAESGMTIQDKIQLKAVDYLVERHGFVTKDEDRRPMIAGDELQVSTIVTEGGIVFSVTGAAVWG